MEDNLENYIDDKFSPAASAQKFFASYGENEIAKKLNDMTKLQQSIENILKQNVRDNYLIFLQANDQIAHVGQEMTDLKHLIENTRKLIQDVRGTKLSDSRAMRANSLLPVLQSKIVEDERRREERQQPEAATGLPAWLLRAPDELAQFVVEQQYQKAVSIVLKCRMHVESLQKSKPSTMTSVSSSDGGNNSTPVMRALEILKNVNQQGAELANTIKRSLLTIPNSPLWGVTEQTKRLKLLIALEEYEIAGEGFSLIKHQHIQRALNSVEFSSNIVIYARDLGKSFLTELLSSVKTFFELFEDQIDDADILSILLEWTQTQTSDFIRFLCRPLRMAVTESSTLMLFHLRDPVVITRMMQSNGNNVAISVPDNADSSGRKSLSPTPLQRRGSILRSSVVIRAANSNTSANTTGNQVNTFGPTGGMTLIVQAIVEVLNDAFDYEEGLKELMKLAGFTGRSSTTSNTTSGRKSVIVNSSAGPSASNKSSSASALTKPFPMVAACAFYLLPELRRMFQEYSEEIIQEVTSQVQQDAWSSVSTTCLEISPLQVNNVDNSNSNDAVVAEVAVSYLWMIAAMNHVFSEIIVMLNKQQQFVKNNTASMSTVVDTRSIGLMSRMEVNELEPAAISVVLRLLVRYLVELESLDISLFTRTQLQTYAYTIDAIGNYMLKSVQVWCDRLFVVERMQLMPTPPSVVFRTIATRIQRIKQSLEQS